MFFAVFMFVYFVLNYMTVTASLIFFLVLTCILNFDYIAQRSNCNCN